MDKLWSNIYVKHMTYGVLAKVGRVMFNKRKVSKLAGDCYAQFNSEGKVIVPFYINIKK